MHVNLCCVLLAFRQTVVKETLADGRKRGQPRSLERAADRTTLS